MKVTVVGAGYVGLTTGIALAYLGHTVTCVDKDPSRIRMLQAGTCPFYEPGLQELMLQVTGRVSFSSDTLASVPDADIIMIAVGTPPRGTGDADTTHVEDAAREVARGVVSGRQYVVVVKSTVPIGTYRRVASVMRKVLEERNVCSSVAVASNPEFLSEGRALRDTFFPDRIIVGGEHQVAIDALRRLYRPILEQTFEPPYFLSRPNGYTLPPLITTDPTSAEMIKYASNAFLAVKISFANEIAGLCDKVGADITEVTRGMGLDARIGPGHLGAGLGWGGSCLPKDTAALLAVAREYNYTLPLVSAAREVNVRQRLLVVEKLQSVLRVLRGRQVGVLGLAFKPNTDDVRDSPALEFVRLLVERGAHVRAHDPAAMPNARRVLHNQDVQYTDDPYEVGRDADVVVVATEWEVYRRLNLASLAALMKGRYFMDGRNAFDRTQVESAGLIYLGVGR